MKKKELLKQLRQFELDLSEVTIGVDLDFQRKKLKKILDEAERGISTQVHGGGTGKD